jgi:hypothetical protein
MQRQRQESNLLGLATLTAFETALVLTSTLPILMESERLELSTF